MKRLLNITLFLSFIFVCFDNNPCQAQVLTSNDGFEGTPAQGTPPPYWNNCNDGYSTVDTQPGFFHNYASASQGQTYISIVTREVNPPGTIETAWAILLSPFEKNKCYSFKVDLSLSHAFYATYNWDDYYFNNPCVLQIIGFNGDCNAPQETELLWQSNVLNNYCWQTFDVLIEPSIATFHNIAFRPFFTPPTNYKCSVVFVDNLRYELTSNALTCQDGIIVLPEGSIGINWYFNNQIITGEHSNQLTSIGSGTYTATFYDTNGCFAIASESLIFNDACACPCAGNIVYFPNVFTPNGDLINDNFRVQGENINQVDIKVYNRWGNLVFETQDKNDLWTGRSRNSDCPAGVYYYVANITFTNEETISKKGTVTLVR